MAKRRAARPRKAAKKNTPLAQQDSGEVPSQSVGPFAGSPKNETHFTPAPNDARERIAAAAASKEAPTPPEKMARRDVYVLFSYDLVNSTAYKSANKERWPLVISYFYQLIEGGLQKWLGGDVKRWKYVGDELLLYRRVRTIGDLRGCLSAAHQVLKDVIARLSDRFADTRALLSVKAVVWCASVDQIPSQDIATIDRTVSRSDAEAGFRNIVLQPETVGGPVDFLGPEIDVGFRLLSGAARRYRLTVGSDLALLLHMDRHNNKGGDHDADHLRIVGYQTLKGIWSGRRYPVIWYEPDWRDIKESFTYDEKFQSKVVARITKMGNPGAELESLDRLVRVATDVGRLPYISQLFDFIQALSPASEDSVSGALQPPNISEVHCVAVCVRSDGRILVAQRPPTKSRYPGYWEFGCGQLEPRETIEECLQRSYKEDFNAQLSFFGKDARPVNSYKIPSKLAGNAPIPGIIFLAAVDNSSAVSPRRHDQIDWVDPLKPESWPTGMHVPDFAETLRLASTALMDLRASMPSLKGADPARNAR